METSPIPSPSAEPTSDAVGASAARPMSAPALRDRAASAGPASRRRRLADSTLPVVGPPATFTLTAGAALFSDQWPTSPQLQAFSRSLERDLAERFLAMDTRYSDLHNFVSDMHGDLNRREGETRNHATQHVAASLTSLRAEIAAAYTPLSDAQLFGAAAVSFRADISTLQGELAAVATRLETLTQQAQALARNTGDEINALRAAGQQQADHHQSFVRDGRALYDELIGMRNLMHAAQTSAGLGPTAAAPVPTAAADTGATAPAAPASASGARGDRFDETPPLPSQVPPSMWTQPSAQAAGVQQGPLAYPNAWTQQAPPGSFAQQWPGLQQPRMPDRGPSLGGWVRFGPLPSWLPPVGTRWGSAGCSLRACCLRRGLGPAMG